MFANQFRASGRLPTAIVAIAVAFAIGGNAQEQPAKPALRTMRIQVLDPDDKALPGVLIHSGVWTKEPFKVNRDYTTDAEGKTIVELPNKIDILRLWATKDGYVGLFAQWWPGMQP